MPRPQGMAVGVHGERHGTGLEVHDFDALVPMWFQPPILRAARVPKSHAVETGQQVVGQPPARIVAVGQRVKLDLAALDRTSLWNAAVYPVGRAARAVDRWATDFHGC